MSKEIAEKIIRKNRGVKLTPFGISVQQLAENYLALFDKVFAEKGEPLPDTIEAHKYHINLLAEQIESDRVEISKLSQTVNQLKQSKAGKKIEALEAENERLRDAMQEAFSVTENTDELNMCNYNHDLVAQLNSGMIEVHAILNEALRGNNSAKEEV